MPVKLFSLNEDLCLTCTNSEFFPYLGYGVGEFAGRRLTALIKKAQAEGEAFLVLVDHIKNLHFVPAELKVKTKAGSIISIKGEFKPVIPMGKKQNEISYFEISDQHYEDIVSKSIDFRKLLASSRERLKELACINQTTKILKEGKPVAEALQQVANILPKGWQFPVDTSAKIRFEGNEYVSSGFREAKWTQLQKFETIDNKIGTIEIFYHRKFPKEYEGPFLLEERQLIENIANIIVGYLNSMVGRTIPKKGAAVSSGKKTETSEVKMSRKLLQKFLTRQNIDRDIFHDLMPFKVTEILLVANLYDAYSIEKDGRFSDHILGEYRQLNLTSMPRITGVSTTEEAFEQLCSKHFDLVILMMGVDRHTPVNISRRIKEEFPYIPIYILLNNNREIAFFKEEENIRSLDKIFVWNGDSSIFFAMVKTLEDKVNVENDTQIGLVNIILIVEDDVKYYSRYLPLLYKIVLGQTKRIIEDVNTDELYRILRLRARPKILLADNYEDALQIFNKYKDFMLCLISDVKFEKEGKLDESAGVKLVKYIRREIKGLPVILQSSDVGNAKKAYELKVTFINKNSDSLLQDVRSFISHYLGFGNFVYRSADGREIAVARSLKEFESHLKTIPDESLIYHARRNHFSLWLMARGEVQIARIINSARVEDFKSPAEIREYLLKVIDKHRKEQNKGKVIPYEESAVLDETNIVSLASGSLGGKGRGLAFANALINNFDFHELVPNINIRSPKTLIIGTDEFEMFMERNHLYQKVYKETDFDLIKQWFLEGRLGSGLMKKLKAVVKMIDKPLAIRSSGLFEDSLLQPFAGIFETYLLPNNYPDVNVRLQYVVDAIKLVYASVFSKTARSYIEAINYKIEEEKMAIIIQEVVGNYFNGSFYPHISGVSQSYNYYPFAHMRPEEGFAVAAVGLGKYVVEGEKAYRFSPKYPELDINTPKDTYKNSQVYFYAVDMMKKELNMLEGDMAGLRKVDIEDAERHGTLRHLASVYDMENNSIVPGLTSSGPRVVNFTNVLKYNYVPLAKTIEVVLDVVKEALGSPVEIEWAVNLNKDKDYRASFYLLQIKPLVGAAHDYHIDLEKIKPEEIILFSEKGMGNGLIDNITDVIFVKNDVFDKSKTVEMTAEIEKLNTKFRGTGKKYILIGPGRWGTRDRWIGIPVNWPQISYAKIIVEVNLEDYPLDASSGSHFFHNVTSMNAGYFSVTQGVSKNKISWDVLDKQKLVNETKYFKHVRFEKPLAVRMDGRDGIAVITYDKE